MTRLSLFCLGGAALATLQYLRLGDDAYVTGAWLLLAAAAYWFRPPAAPLYQITLNQPMTFPRVSYTELASPAPN